LHVQNLAGQKSCQNIENIPWYSVSPESNLTCATQQKPFLSMFNENQFTNGFLIIPKKIEAKNGSKKTVNKLIMPHDIVGSKED
jgi:hypothetical protein